MAQDFVKIVKEAFTDDMKEIVNGPVKEIHDIIGKVYEKGLTRGMELQRMNLQFVIASKWIKAADQLPNDGETVIVAHRWVQGEVLYDSDVYHEDTGWEGYDNDDIIAWMPIPKLND